MSSAVISFMIEAALLERFGRLPAVEQVDLVHCEDGDTGRTSGAPGPSASCHWATTSPRSIPPRSRPCCASRPPRRTDMTDRLDVYFSADDPDLLLLNVYEDAELAAQPLLDVDQAVELVTEILTYAAVVRRRRRQTGNAPAKCLLRFGPSVVLLRMHAGPRPQRR